MSMEEVICNYIYQLERHAKEKKHTDNASGDCNALDRNSEMPPSLRLLICKQRD